MAWAAPVAKMVAAEFASVARLHRGITPRVGDDTRVHELGPAPIVIRARRRVVSPRPEETP